MRKIILTYSSPCCTNKNIVINAETGEHESVHAHPEFRRWLGKDLIRIAGIMAGGDLTDEQLAASEELEKVAANA